MENKSVIEHEIRLLDHIHEFLLNKLDEYIDLGFINKEERKEIFNYEKVCYLKKVEEMRGWVVD